ncbi:MAG: ABC transporter ATP-binding protein [Clostridiaceae bacterium]|nr:ABC transporter ATP-binding protein [Clostridiaceae bacterium]
MSMIRNSRFVLKQVGKACPSYLPLTLLLAISGVAAPLVSVLGIKLLIDALMMQDPGQTWIILVVFGLITAITAIFQSWYQTVYEPVAKVRISGAMTSMLLNHIAAADLAVLENTEFYNQYTRAITEANTRAQGVVNTLCGMAGNIVSIIALAAILINLDAFVLVLTLAGAALIFVIDLLKSRLSFRQYLERTNLERRLNYIQRIYYEPQYSREIRLFAMNPFMMTRYTAIFRNLWQLLHRQGRKLWLFSGCEKLLNSCVFILATLLYLTMRFFAGAVTLGSFSALFNGVFQVGDQVYALLARLPDLYQHSLYLDTVQFIINRPPVIEQTTGLDLDPAAPHSIELRDVTFAYPGRPPVLSHINLSIAAGEQVALLGHNGAGKSSLIQLLLRFYDPQEGQILIDGQDIRAIDIRSLRRCFGVVLQNFQHFAFSVADNIALGRPDCTPDQIEAALVQAHLEEKIRKLPSGMDTAITREFDDTGIQLSGGEFQKLALARAYARNNGILLFDEPSSALDPIAEHQLFQEIKQYAKQKTVIYICHKMSLAVSADRVILLDRGRIAEEGAPEELLQAGGLYASLYRLQTEDEHRLKSHCA